MELTSQEIKILDGLYALGAKWLARDFDGGLTGFTEKPTRIDEKHYWASQPKEVMFDFDGLLEKFFEEIRSEDAEPKSIAGLLDGTTGKAPQESGAESLAERERKLLAALDALGIRWLTKETDGYVAGHTKKPTREVTDGYVDWEQPEGGFLLSFEKGFDDFFAYIEPGGLEPTDVVNTLKGF